MDLELESEVEVTKVMTSDGGDTRRTYTGLPNTSYNSFGTGTSLNNLPSPRPDIFLPLSGFDTPRFLRDGSSFLRSPHSPAERIFRAPLQSPLGLQITPLGPLPSPFGELPTPGFFAPTPSPLRETPRAFLQPPTFRGHTAAELFQNPVFSLQTTEDEVQISNTEQQVNLPPQASPDVFSDAPLENINNTSIDTGDLFPETPQEAVETPSGKKGKNLCGSNAPLVRRRLFEQCEETCDMEPDNTAGSRHNQNNIVAKSGKKLPGLRARLEPPPPIRIPGPPNTTPGGIFPIHKKPKLDDLAAEEVQRPLKAVPQPPYSQHLNDSNIDMNSTNRGALLQPMSITGTQLTATQSNKQKSIEKKEIKEKKVAISERASLVLAEMRRQMSDASTGARGSGLKKGTDATNYLPYSSAVQDPRGSQQAEEERPVCNCKASQCIKRYCPCFATSNFCGKDCGCRNCENTSEYSSVVGRARRVLLERDPNAFVARIRNTQRSSGRGRQTIRGCNCRKGCEKNYCICKENGLICGVRCTCSGPNGCQNHDESKLGAVSQVVENAPRSRPRSNSGIQPKELNCDIHQDFQHLNNQGVVLPEPGSNNNRSVQRNHSQPRNLDICDATRLPGRHEVLPTPTTPSLRNHPFFERESGQPKRRITFGEPTDGFKRIRVGDDAGIVLTEMKQSSPEYSAKEFRTPQHFSQAPSFVGTPLTTRVFSTDTPDENTNNTAHRNDCVNAKVNHEVDTSSGTADDTDRRLSHVPRIFRYKFGSGKRTVHFGFNS